MLFDRMVWKEGYLDAILVPMGTIILLGYQASLYWRVTHFPLKTVVGVNHLARRQWVYTMMKENDKKGILAVQTLRNTIMTSTLMATTAVLMCSATVALMASAYFNGKTTLLGGHSQNLVNVKYFCMLSCFVASFICYAQSVRYVNHVNFLVNVPLQLDEQYGHSGSCIRISPDYVANVLAKGFDFFTLGTRGFYTAFPLVLWLFGPIPVLLASIALVPLLHFLDVTDLEDCGVDDLPRYTTQPKFAPNPNLDVQANSDSPKSASDHHWNTVELTIRPAQPELGR